jgi:alpha-L-fucosidase 2
VTATRRHILQGGAALVASPALPAVAAETNPLTLWYRQPAATWTEALPVGNGRLGAMIFGGIAQERIQINEDTLWGGAPHDYTSPGAREHLAQLRDLIFAGRIAEAEKLTADMMGRPTLLMPYQAFCDLHLLVEGTDGAERYQRSLLLDEAVTTVTYRAGGIQFRREVIASHPGQVLAVRLTADQPGSQNLTIALDSPQPGAVVRTYGNTLELTGQIQPRENPAQSWIGSWSQPGLRYAGLAQVQTEGGTVTAENGRLVVRMADAVTILFSGATSFRSYTDITGDALAWARAFLDAAWPMPYEMLRAAHVSDHQALFRRVDLDLGAGPDLPTDQRIAAVKTQADPALASLYFQFGRYLLIASSRPGGQPANLQGLWNEQLRPPWGSKWTTNINLQMNYWLAEAGALWETQTPLWDLIADLQITGSETARVHYGARGWVLHHNTDLWRAAAPVDGPWGVWPMGAVWLANQMWDHYRFSLDRRFLEKRAWPAMQGAVRFVLDTLVEAPAGSRFAGKLVTNPSFSPENTYLLNGQKAQLTYAATMDLELIRELFDAFAQASQLLDREAATREEALKAKSRLPPLQIGARGQLQEWIEDYPEFEPEHRHVSHLWALYPGHGIAPGVTPELAAAARRTLELRGDGGTGWSKAWKIALWARLRDGDHAHLMFRGLLEESTLPDMFDTHPPFQIDGNFGAAAAIAEMLVQSDDDAVWLLPALPSAWPQGRLRGLRARGGIAVDMQWRGGKLERAALTANTNRSVTVRYGDRSAALHLPAGRPVRVGPSLGRV